MFKLCEKIERVITSNKKISFDKIQIIAEEKY